MSKIALVAAALLAAAPLATASWSAARAAPLSGGEIRARSSGGEFRGFGRTPRSQIEDVIWRLFPDGRATSVSILRRRTPFGGYAEEYRDVGAWRVEGDRLCVRFDTVHGYLSGCYVVDGTGGDHVRLIGPVQLEGTLGH
jgi:hypothetical protein